tara:strand:+ start:60 stop:479 length:420 start_codon:yes stop_codon:yes gene_type:complete
MQCETCVLDPTSHSFKELCKIDNTIYFYSCPGEASKYYDISGILHHYDIVLSTMDPSSRWIYVFDCSGFEMKHLLEYEIGIGLAKLFSEKHGFNLDKIYIINPNWYIYTMVSVVWPFLNSRLRELIVYDNGENYIFQNK